ncbi:hypothetical protein CMV30_00835 [Nibricoccus aquaticus]|uniref:Peptidase C1A papain C-terminal domain-containing protein n=1 Tax=Nibricoccus aquaticus TaxID=2576891 RepID=A0A290Q623_9BACT|nr:C1 family peptidase [Nibricoccus aquaticus]ATC62630.1 hypothetical protein CMV30_00835 [Nibricoccus aquaticus]
MSPARTHPLIPLAVIGTFALCAIAVSLRAQTPDTPAPAPLVAGATLDSITVGQITYTQVRIRTISAQTAMIQHAGGIASLRLRDLSPDLQQRFGYNPDAAAAEAEKQKAAAAAAAKLRQEQLAAQKKANAVQLVAQARESKKENTLDVLLRTFGSEPDIRAGIDLRPRYNELGLWIKNQGARSSCAIFAIVSALELQAAEITGHPQRYSEEYLQWATRKTLNRPAFTPQSVKATVAGGIISAEAPPPDEGFRLLDVVTALRAYGIPERERVPYRSSDLIDDPSEEIIQEARTKLQVACHILPGKTQPDILANIIHALNAGVPVPIGMSWPVENAGIYKTGYLDKQRTNQDGGHAVTIVGYKSTGGRLENTVFIFKNSYGTRWGIDGYGTATYAFLEENLSYGVLLDISEK